MSEAMAFIAGLVAMGTIWFINDNSSSTSPYRRGFEDGYRKAMEDYEAEERRMMKTMGKPDKVLVEVMKHTCDDVQKKIDEAYQRGVKDGQNETWEAAKKVSLQVDEGGLSVEKLDEIFGCFTLQQVFRKYSAQQTIAKLKVYGEELKK